MPYRLLICTTTWKGIVTWDDVQDIVEEETTDEIFTSSGIVTDLGDDDDDILTGSLAHSIKARIPWLFITLIGEFIAVTVTNRFDKSFTALPIIAAFMPLLAGLGGNIGTQSITLMVRGMSTGQISLSSGWHQIMRETITGLSIGAIFGVLVTLVTWGWQHNLELGIDCWYCDVTKHDYRNNDWYLYTFNPEKITY